MSGKPHTLQRWEYVTKKVTNNKIYKIKIMAKLNKEEIKLKEDNNE